MRCREVLTGPDPVCFSVTMINTMTKSGLRGKGLFGSHAPITVHPREEPGPELKQGRHLEAGTEAEIMEACRLLAHSITAFSTCFLMQAWATCPEMTLPTVGCDLPQQLLINKMPSSTCLQTSITEAISQLRFPGDFTLSQADKNWSAYSPSALR